MTGRTESTSNSLVDPDARATKNIGVLLVEIAHRLLWHDFGTDLVQKSAITKGQKILPSDEAQLP